MLSLIEHTKIRVIRGDKTELVAVQDCAEYEQAFDLYGNVFPMRVEKASQPENRIVTGLSHAEPLMFGENHEVFCRTMTDAVWARRPLKDLKDAVMVKLPQKKTEAYQELFDALDYDKDGVCVRFESVKELPTLMELAGTLGVTVFRHPTEKRVDLNKGRPVCFASKLINGNFQEDFEGTMSNLAHGGIIVPWRMYDNDMLEETKRTGIIFEGTSVFNDILMMPPKMIERPIEVWHVTPVQKVAYTPVELPWLMT